LKATACVHAACGSLLLRAVAVTENLGLEVYIYKPGVALIAISNEATVSGKACRLASVAIDKLNLSELYVARQRFHRPGTGRRDKILRGLHLGCAPENRQLTGPLEAVAPGSGLSLR